MNKQNYKNRRLPHCLCSALSGIIAGGAAGAVFVPGAYAERGYFAIGGEWILVIAVTVLTAYAVYRFDKWCQRNLQMEEKECRNKHHAARELIAGEENETDTV